MPSRIASFPLSMSIKSLEEFLGGLSLLATHINVVGDTLLYYISKYLLNEFPKLKNPTSKFLATKDNVLLS